MFHFNAAIVGKIMEEEKKEEEEGEGIPLQVIRWVLEAGGGSGGTGGTVRCSLRTRNEG